MARFVDLDEDGTDVSPIPDPHILTLLQASRSSDRNGVGAVGKEPPASEPAPKATTRSAATEAFQCYPIVVAVASFIDLNTLDSLARTSRNIHDGLIQYRKILLASTLRCANEGAPVDGEETFRYRARAGNWYYMEDGRSYNGKSGDCARDLNCAIKPPAPVALRERHRRLCRACARAPVATLLKPPLDPKLDVHSDAISREICRCDADGVWLCQPCGRSIRGADHEYYRIWRWRNHYGEVLGGLGTGIGDGDRGVICGREERCCAAKEREQEIDCDAEDARDNSTTPWLSEQHVQLGPYAGTPTLSPHTNSVAAAASTSSLALDTQSEGMRHERASTPQLGPGYSRHEIEGIGGIVKRKLVRMVRVGACVPEYEDEKTAGSRSLGREARGEVRSWCGWCWRVIPGAKDYLGPKAPPSPEVRREVLV
ncbi:hypothetical protein HJFPF1_04620 [Paramyrothecium foliicola]|nr:hypothetical protein HJFPF1_04620 [Paramyrothecium foliicola]